MMRVLVRLALLVMLMLPENAAWATLDPEDQRLIDEAIQRGCL